MPALAPVTSTVLPRRRDALKTDILRDAMVFLRIPRPCLCIASGRGRKESRAMTGKAIDQPGRACAPLFHRRISSCISPCIILSSSICALSTRLWFLAQLQTTAFRTERVNVGWAIRTVARARQRAGLACCDGWMSNTAWMRTNSLLRRGAWKVRDAMCDVVRRPIDRSRCWARSLRYENMLGMQAVNR